MSANPDTTPDATISPGSIVVERLIRFHNLFVFLILGGMMGCLIVAKTFKPFGQNPEWAGWLFWPRVAFPLAALGVTGWLTSRALRRIAADMGTATEEQIAQTFYVCKRISILLLGAAGMFSALCLLVTHRNLDGLLLVGALGLLMISRPSARGYAHFVGLAAMFHK